MLDSRLNTDTTTSSEAPPSVDSSKMGAQKGLLRCLLKLGRLDSVLNQAYGMSSMQSQRTGNICDELLPSAAEAAWRLGNWPLLDTLVGADEETLSDGNGRFQLSFGRAMHSLQSGSPANFTSSLQHARECVMSSLSSAARDSYSRSYPYLMQLHSVREVECMASDLNIFNESSQHKKSFLSFVSSEEWRNRLNISTPDATGSNAIINTRLALCRMSNEPIAQGAMWLDIGKDARKAGLYQVAEHSLTQADVSFCSSIRDDTPETSVVRESIGQVQLQFAKLKYAMGESTTALKLIEDGIPSPCFQLDGEHLKSFIVKSTHESVEIVGRRILQSTEWMVSDGLKSKSEISNRYRTVLELAPNWERGVYGVLNYFLITTSRSLC